MQNSQFTIEDLQKAIDRVQAASETPPEYIFYVIQPWIDAAPEYFYQDESKPPIRKQMPSKLDPYKEIINEKLKPCCSYNLIYKFICKKAG